MGMGGENIQNIDEKLRIATLKIEKVVNRTELKTIDKRK